MYNFQIILTVALLLQFFGTNTPLSAASVFPEAETVCHFGFAEDKITHLLNAENENPIFLEDLIGNPCYAQPNNLVTCGLGDTIPIILYTKTTDTIYDIILNVEYGEGLEYATFAYVHDPFDNNFADLDTVNVQNPESPTFRINELSQSQGAVVVYLGVRAACGVDFDSYTPSITYSLTYTAGGQNCTEEFNPEVDYSANILSPGIAFIGDTSPAVASFTDFDTDNCISMEVSGTTPGAGLVEAVLTLTDTDFDLSGITVNGTSVPPTDIETDAVTGLTTVNLNGVAHSAYWGADGQLTFDETVPIQVCYRVSACSGAESTPTFSVQSACTGEICGGSPDFAGVSLLREGFTFNPSGVQTFTQLAEPSFCNPTEPTPYVYEASFRSNNSTPVKGDFYNLLYLVDACPSSFLSVDTLILLDGASGNPVGGVPRSQIKDIIYTNASGRMYFDFRSLDIGFDPDGAGGLEDIDGDGIFDDLAAGNTLYFRVEMSPSCSSEQLACATSAGGVCDITTQYWQGLRNCGRDGFFFTNNINDGIPGYANTSSGSFDNTVDFSAFNNNYNGYRVPNTYSPSNPQFTDVAFSYELGANDFASCPSGGPVRLQVQIFSTDSVTQDVVLSDILFDGNPANILSEETEDGTKRYIIDAGSAAPGTHDYSFRLTFDNAFCSPIILADLQALVIQDCDGCDCILSKACDAVTLGVDPANPPEGCISGRNFVEIERLNRGFTDRTLNTALTENDVAEDDKTRLLPGDVVRLKGWIAVDDPMDWNRNDRSLSFNMLHLQNSSTTARTLLTSRIEIGLARLQSFTLKRSTTGEIFDLGAIPFSGDFNNNINNSSGAFVNNGRSLHDPTVNNPGITGSQYIQAIHVNNVNDWVDNNALRVHFGLGTQVPNDQPALQEFYEYIDGGFVAADTVFMEWEVPIVSTPRFLSDGSSTIDGAPLENGYFRLDVDGRSWTGSLSSSNISTTNGDAEYEYYEPQIVSEREIIVSDDGCEAELVHKFSIANPPPADWFAGEFRPIIGIEDFVTDIPQGYYATSQMSLNHYDEISQTIIPDSTQNMNSVQIGGNAAFLSDGGTGKMYFIDAETKNGLRERSYEAFDTGDTDITLTGGTFPLLGVGLNPTGTAEADFIEFKIPLKRVCAATGNLPPLLSTYNASYNHLPDYFISGYRCNRGNWFGFTATTDDCSSNGLPNFYWPYYREDDGNPHHVANDSTGIYTETGTPQINYTASNETFLPNDVIIDAAGNEMTDYSINLNNAIPDGLLILSTSQAFDLISIEGNPPTLVAQTDSNTVYYYQLGARPAGNLTLPLVTNLQYCDEAVLSIDAVLGCVSTPAETARVVAAGGVACNLAELSYVSGLPELSTEFTLNQQTQLCAEEEYTILYRNNGSTDFIDFFPTVYLPTGMEIVPGSFSFQLQGMSSVTNIADPTENTDKTGVNGTAYEWMTGTFSDIPAGSSLAIYFRAATTCNSLLGMPLATEVNASVACNRDFASEPQRSRPVTVIQPGVAVPDFSFTDDRYQISCDGGASVLLTAVNSGKAPSSADRICLTLPAGISAAASDFAFEAPAGVTVTGFTSEAVGTGGAVRVCLDGPPLAEGGFFCLRADFEADLACGDQDIALTVVREEDFVCSATGEVCSVEVVSGAEQFLTLEVNPPLALQSAPTVEASCAAAGTYDINYTLPLKNITTAVFNGDLTTELFFDIDGNGTLDPEDVALGSQAAPLNVTPDETETVTGSFNVAEAQSCGLIFRLTAPGCTCSEILVPVPEVIPDFLTEVGSDIALCPGGDFDLELPCGNVDYRFEPAAAGTAVLNGMTLTLDLNPGFGETGPVKLILESSLGNCIAQQRAINVTRVVDFTFTDRTHTVCADGCTQLDLGIPIGLAEDVQVSYNPMTFLEDPTATEPTVCNPTSAQSYTVTYSLNGECTTSSVLEVIPETPPTVSVSPIPADCKTLGFTLEDLVTVMPADLDAVWETRGDGEFTAGTDFGVAGNLYVPGEADRDSTRVLLILKTRDEFADGTSFDSPCGAFIQRFFVTVQPCLDFGDLPDAGAASGGVNYPTSQANNGPSHVLIPGLAIGNTADFEDGGQQNDTATGDGSDEDGFGFGSQTSVTPGTTLNIPVNITNTTGDIAYLVGWIDWNADGIFTDDEQVIDLIDDGAGNTGVTHVPVTVPAGVARDSDFGLRFRLSHTDDLTPEGRADAGEVEDYLLRANCAQGACRSVLLNKN